jgi:tetratricopeptide (TPR) repeat protein
LFAIVVGVVTLVTGSGFARGAAPGAPGADVAALIQAGHWKAARAILEPQVREHPQDARACSELAQVKMAFGDLDGALPLAQKAVDLDGKNSGYHLALGHVYGRMAERASIFSAGSLAVKFRKEMETAIALDGANLDALDSLMQFKFQAPGLMGGSKDEARALADKITALNASEGALDHAELAEMEKNTSQQEAYLVRAVQANPHSYGAQTALADFYSRPAHANYALAAEHAQAALGIDAGQVGALNVLARVHARQEHWAELDQFLATAAKNVPDDLTPYYAAAEVLLDTGTDLRRGEGYARKYLSQEPEGEAPDRADAHRLLGLLLAKQGRNAEARAELNAALQLRPNFKAAKDDLKRLPE